MAMHSSKLLLRVVSAHYIRKQENVRSISNKVSWCQLLQLNRTWTLSGVRYLSNDSEQDFDQELYVNKPRTSSDRFDLSEDGLEYDSDNNEDEITRGIGDSNANYYKKVLMKPDQPKEAKILKVALIGSPNAGKSSLINQLMNMKVNAVSKKIDTTRRNVLAVHTEGNTQIIYTDTPGIVEPHRRKKIKMSSEFQSNPEESLKQVDMVGVVVDTSNIWSRERLDSRILYLLHLNQHLPAFLILNKIDLMRDKRNLLSVTKNLTLGKFASKELDKSVGTDDRQSYNDYDDDDYYNDNYNDNRYDHDYYDDNIDVHPAKVETYLRSGKEKIKHFRTNLDEKRITDYESIDVEDDARYRLLQLSVGLNPSTEYAIEKTEEANPHLVESFQPQTGWENFKDVFMISAKYGQGVEDLKDYLMGEAVEGDWLFNSNVVTDQTSEEVAISIVKEKILDNVTTITPYNLIPRVTDWHAKSDFLRISMEIQSSDKYTMKKLLEQRGQVIKQIISESNQELMNAFRKTVRLHINVNLKNRM